MKLTKAMQEYFEQHPSSATYTCRDCGRTDQGYYVQPMYPAWVGGQEGVALCGDCINRINEEARARRKAELATLPRCGVPKCKRRGSWKTMGVLLCGRHLSRVKAEHNKSMASVGGMGLFLTVSYDRAAILDMAQRQGR